MGLELGSYARRPCVHRAPQRLRWYRPRDGSGITQVCLGLLGEQLRALRFKPGVCTHCKRSLCLVPRRSGDIGWKQPGGDRLQRELPDDGEGEAAASRGETQTSVSDVQEALHDEAARWQVLFTRVWPDGLAAA